MSSGARSRKESSAWKWVALAARLLGLSAAQALAIDQWLRAFTESVGGAGACRPCSHAGVTIWVTELARNALKEQDVKYFATLRNRRALDMKHVLIDVAISAIQELAVASSGEPLVFTLTERGNCC